MAWSVPEAMKTTVFTDIQPTGSGKAASTDALVLAAGHPRLLFMRFWAGGGTMVAQELRAALDQVKTIKQRERLQ
ncbi:hypothetical protein HPT29_025785 (plasmid) [Microvirga terrae]|uniref:Uncharacterized protein n=1 Tax=Microvirga terrae TaxID=2740529 RepID=A0ABY5RZ87_9HYPH|nr:hypothetical protein [Microvirga terrae]UVF22556.1 hypothetical protein HPT29_025785 [Microvirga terrae]